MSFCYSQVGLSVVGTGPLVVFDAADLDGTGPCPLMGMASILPSCVVNFQVLHISPIFFSQLFLKFLKYLLLYSIKSNDPAHATLFWSMKI